MSKSRSKAPGELSDVDEKEQSVMPSSNVESTKKRENRTTLDTSASSPSQTSQIGFQATKALEESKETTNARIISTFADALGDLVEWRRLTLADGREVFALCFPVRSWEISPNGELQPVRSAAHEK